MPESGISRTAGRCRCLQMMDFRHVLGGDLLCQTLNDCRLANTCLANQHRIVLGAAAEHLDDAQDLLVAPDHRIQFCFVGILCQVTAVLFQRPVLRLGVRAGHTLPATDLFDGIVNPLLGDAVVAQNAVCRRATLAGDSQENVLGRDVLVLEGTGLLVGQ